MFNVKERQDFRTLFTDPPISFSEKYPAGPKPDNRLTPLLIAAWWFLHDLYGEDMPSVAAELLEAGYDSPSLRRLAGETNVTHSEDVNTLVAQMLREMSVTDPLTDSQARFIFTRQIAREVIAGERNAWAAASHLRTVIWNRKAQTPDLRDISELLDALDWEAVNKNKLPQLTSELIAVFARLGSLADDELNR